MHRLTVIYDVWDADTREAPGEYGGSGVLMKAEDLVYAELALARAKHPLGIGGWRGELLFSYNGRYWHGHWEAERS